MVRAVSTGVRVNSGLARVGVVGLVDEAGGQAELGDDVADRAHSHSFAAPGQEQRAGVVGTAMSRPDVQPGPQRDTSGVVQRDLAVDRVAVGAEVRSGGQPVEEPGDAGAVAALGVVGQVRRGERIGS